MSWLFSSGGQSTGASASASVLPMNILGWFPLGLTGLTRRDSRVFSSTTVQKHERSAFFMVQVSHLYMTTGKTIALTRWTFVGKVMSLPFNMLSRFVITFFSRIKHLLISWLQSPSAVILERKKIKSVTVSILSPSICHLAWDRMPWSLFFECWVLSQLFHSPLSLSKGSLVAFCHKGGVIFVFEVIDISPSNLDSSLCFLQLSISHDVLCI